MGLAFIFAETSLPFVNECRVIVPIAVEVKWLGAFIRKPHCHRVHLHAGENLKRESPEYPRSATCNLCLQEGYANCSMTGRSQAASPAHLPESAHLRQISHVRSQLTSGQADQQGNNGGVAFGGPASRTQ